MVTIVRATEFVNKYPNLFMWCELAKRKLDNHVSQVRYWKVVIETLEKL